MGVIFASLFGQPSSVEGFWVLLVLILSFAFVYLSFYRMRFRITTEGVWASMPPFSYGVKYSEIERVYIDKTPFWMGWGLRLWWRRIAFVSRHGSAVVIRKKEGVFRTFMLSSRGPDKFVGMISNKVLIKEG
jgi:hypothetical protein